jgi:hypothetical protein
LIFLSPANVPEIWMNSINVQIFLSILSLILVFIEYEKNKLNYFNTLLIVLSGFSGIYSCILTPIFYFKYAIFKTIQDKLNFLSILSCTIVQLSIIFYSKYNNLISSGKLHTVDLDLIQNFIYNVLVKSFLGISLTKLIYFKLNFSNFFLTSLVVISFLIIFLIIRNLLKKMQVDKKHNFILISFLYIFFATSLVVIVGATYKYVGGRYAALPSFYLLGLFLFLYKMFHEYKIKYFFSLLIVIAISTGLYEFRPNTKSSKNNYIKFLDCVGCPNWIDEVNRFDQNKNYYLKIWPYPLKTMTLN